MEDCLLACTALPLFSFVLLSTHLAVRKAIWLHKPACLQLFSNSFAHSALLPHASSFLAGLRPLQDPTSTCFLQRHEDRLCFFYCLQSPLVATVSFHWRASLSRSIPFLASSPRLGYCTTWSTRVAVMPRLKFSPDGGMKEGGWLLFVSVCRFEVLDSWIYGWSNTFSCNGPQPLPFSYRVLVCSDMGKRFIPCFRHQVNNIFLFKSNCSMAPFLLGE